MLHARHAALLLLAVTSLFCTSCHPRPETGTITAAHAIGLCNLPMFVMAEKQTAKSYGAEIRLVDIANWSDHPAALASGGVDVSVTPFTTVLNAAANGLPLRIIAGSGLNGLFLLGQPGITSIQQLRGKKIGTFRADTLEVAAYDSLRRAGLTKADFQMVYFTTGSELMMAFARKAVDAMTHVEPYATQARTKYGATVLSTGQDVWGGDHPDCVLVTTLDVLKKKPALLQAVIAGMFEAESFIEHNYEDAVDLCMNKYYKADRSDILLAGRSQPVGIDIRDKRQFILDRADSLKALGYINGPVDQNLIDFSLLNEVVKRHPELLSAVRVRAAVR